MGSDWDASDSDDGAKPAAAAAKPVVILPKKSKFADEDASDSDVKDDWDASDDDEDDKKKAPAKPTGPAPPVRQKGITKQKIAEKEAAEQAKLQEMEARRNDTPQERKAREKAAMLKADLENARALLGGSSIGGGGGGEDLLTQPCNSVAEFTSLSSSIADILVSAHGDKPGYAAFVETFVRAIAQPLSDLEVKKAASALTTLANEKQAAAKAGGKKKKGASKPGLAVGGKTVERDTRTYEEALDDDYDDFM